jgi:hypothetical protein
MTIEILHQQVSDEEKRAALDFALQSQSLGRSDRLKSFLSYICEAEFEGRHERLTEYEIATSALGRRENFSPIEDSTVRSRAYELRQKLERLYTLEAPDYPVQIDLPKGSYRPTFRYTPRPSSNGDTSGLSTQNAMPRKAQRLAIVLGVSGFFVGVVATAIIAVLLSARHSESDPPARVQASNLGWTTELRELWAPFTSSQRSIAVTFETRLFVTFGSALVVRDTDIENMGSIESSEPIMKIKRLFKANEVYEVRRYSDFSAANALFFIARLLSPTGVAMKAERSVDMTNEDVHSCNLVLVGKPGAYDGIRNGPPLGFNFVYQKDRSIRNIHPRPGELETYPASHNLAIAGDLIQAYAVITMTPGPEKGQHILSLIGADSELFWPLALYVTDPIYAKELVEHLRLPSGKLPNSYEVLINIQERNQRPIRVSYVAHRVLPGSQ